MRPSPRPHPPERDFARWRRNADARALERVFERLAPELLIVAAHVGERCDAEDLVQTTFLLAIDHSERWDEGRPLLPWLVGILVKQSLKDKARARRVVDPERLSRSSVRDPESEAQRLEFAQSVASALEGLPLHYRQVLTLRLVHGLEPTAISHALGTPIATVKSRLQRGLKRLRDALPAGVRVPAAILVPYATLDSVRESVLAHAASKAAVAGAVTSTTLPLVGAVLMSKILVAVAGVALALYFGVTRWDTADPDPDATNAAGEVATKVSPTALSPDHERLAPLEVGRTNGGTSARSPVELPANEVLPNATSAGTAELVATIRGRVVDERGRPLAAVDVFLADRRFRQFRDAPSFLARVAKADFESLVVEANVGRVSTDDRGRFEFDRPGPEHEHLLVAWSASRGGREGDLSSEDEVEIVLPIDALVHGVVRSADGGAPIEQAQVQVWPSDSGYPIAYQRTDANGEYEHQRLPPGEYRVSVEAEGFSEHDGSFALLDGQTRLVQNYDLQPLPVFRAQLVDGSRSPWTLQRLADSLGRDRTEGTRWAVSVTESAFARRGEMEAESWRVQWMDVDSDGVVQGFVERPDARVLAVWRGSEKVLEGTVPDFGAEEVVAALTDRTTVALQVRVELDPPSEGATSIRIELTDPSGFGARSTPILARTTTTPECTLLVPAQFVGNECGLVVECEGRVPYSGRLMVPKDSSDVWHHVVLSPPAARFAATVVDTEGAPLAGAQVTLVDREGRAFLPWGLASTSAGIDGKVSIEGLPAGPLRALVSAPDRAVRAFEIDTSEGEQRLVLRAPRKFSIRMPSTIGAGQVRVLDGDGLPVKDDRISGSMSYGGASLLLDDDAMSVEVYDAATGALVARGDVPAAGELVLEPVD